MHNLKKLFQKAHLPYLLSESVPCEYITPSPQLTFLITSRKSFSLDDVSLPAWPTLLFKMQTVKNRKIKIRYYVYVVKKKRIFSKKITCLVKAPPFSRSLSLSSETEILNPILLSLLTHLQPYRQNE